MIRYENCKNVDSNKIYEAFSVGFSDYIIKMEMSREEFFNRFFGPEGNDLKHSFIALDEDVPVGLILGGIKNYEGIKTLRCGTLCVHPDYRGKGISNKLFEFHRNAAVENNCKQMFLEVIADNHGAVRFYEKNGYEKIYEIRYYTCKDLSKIESKNNDEVSIKEINFDDILNFDVKIHINWQNDFDYMKKLSGLKYYGVYRDNILVGAISISTNGRIFFIWVNEKYRHNGIGKSLIGHAVKELNLKTLSINFPNNASLEGFVKKLNFQKEKLSQYEMYLFID